MKRSLAILIIILMAGWGAGCSPSGDDSSEGDKKSASGNSNDGLTAFQKEHGIGPVEKPLELASLQKEMAARGEELFTTNCSSCHKMDQRYVGPPLRDVVDKRSPEYVMNMILNPDEMVKKHPEAKKMLAKYMTPMPYQNVSREEARAILEYLRFVNKNESKTSVSG